MSGYGEVELTPLERAGYVNAHLKDGAGCYRFALDQAEGLLAAWTKGAAFFTGTSACGSQTTVKLALIEGVSVMTPDAIAKSQSADADDRTRERARKLVEGEP